MDYKFCVEIYKDEKYEELISLEHYITHPDQVEVEINLSKSTLSLQVHQQELLGSEYGFGQLNLIAIQLEAVADRLRSQQIALLRSANYDSINAPYLVFEPGESLVYISILYFQDDYDNHFPIDGLVDNCPSAALYKHVIDHYTEVLARNQDALYKSHFTRVPYPKPQLLEDIDREIHFIQEFYRLKSKDLKLEFYFDGYRR